MPPLRFALFAATAGVLAMTVVALRVGAPTLGWAALALVSYAGLLLSGVLVLRLRVFADAIVRGPPGARGVALTFDDGPDPRSTQRVLDRLAEHGAVATFFLIGHKVEAHPEVVRSILAAGHAVGLHSYHHDRLFAIRGEKRVQADLERGIAAIEAVTGSRPALFRPPMGHTNPAIARVADALDLVVVGWTLGARDGVAWARPEDVGARIRRGMSDGAIVLLHDAPERGDREPASVRALPGILDALNAARLDVVPLSRWIAAPVVVVPPGGPEAGGGSSEV